MLKLMPHGASTQRRREPQRSRREIALLCVLCALLFSALIFSSPDTHQAQTPDASRSHTETKRIHLNPPGAQSSRYFYVPFEVPARASRIHVSFAYDRANNTNTLDLGVFDSRFSGRDDDSRGFRGWSGGSRTEFFITPTEATPAYIPGALTPGTWRIGLGMYRVAPGGVDVMLNIKIETNPNEAKDISSPSRSASLPPHNSAHLTVSAATPTPRRMERAPLLPSSQSERTPQWFRGDLHMHTVHSDGTWTVPQLYESAQANRLDFISITDHNTSSHHAEIDRLSSAANRPLVMRGEEVTTYNGHANAWGLPSGKWLDFRVRAGDEKRLKEIVNEAHTSGALISINHPTARCKGCDWSYSSEGFDAMEVWNGRWDAEDEGALQIWDRLLREGRRLTAIGSSDTHKPDTPSNALALPTTYIRATSLSERALLEGIRAGQVFVTSAPDDLRINFHARAPQHKGAEPSAIGGELRLNGAKLIELLLSVESLPAEATVLLIARSGELRRFTPDARGQVNVTERVSFDERDSIADTFFRVEVRDRENRMLLFTNPIYIKANQPAKQ